MGRNLGSKFNAPTAALLLLLAAFAVSAQTLAPLRPPAVPLVTHDPYFSVWSMSDRLTDDRTKHWTGAPHGMVGMARIDGRAYRLMGQSHNPLPEPMPQTALEVTPTRTIYRFVNESPSRVPLTDWYGTVDGKQVGFHARSVVGGVYVKLLSDPALWKKWSTRAAR
jgi:hypothetical protein